MGAANCCHHAPDAGPRDILMAEHRVIESVLDAVGRMVESGDVDAGFLQLAVDFFRNFADGCHHAKEEDALFPALERAGIPRLGGPVGVMLDEHQEGRRLLAEIMDNLEAASGDSWAAGKVRSAAAGYVHLLRQHILKEDNVLFVMADQVLTPDAQRGVLEKFDLIEAHEGRDGRHERYLKVAEKLESWEFKASPLRAQNAEA